jgi:hypothetical protein
MEPEGLLPCFQEPTSGPCPEQDQPNPYTSQPINLSSILILSNHLRLGLPSSLFPYGFATKITCIPLFTIHATCPANLTLLDLIILIILDEEY